MTALCKCSMLYVNERLPGSTPYLELFAEYCCLNLNEISSLLCLRDSLKDNSSYLQLIHQNITVNINTVKILSLQNFSSKNVF